MITFFFLLVFGCLACGGVFWGRLFGFVCLVFFLVFPLLTLIGLKEFYSPCIMFY